MRYDDIIVEDIGRGKRLVYMWKGERIKVKICEICDGYILVRGALLNSKGKAYGFWSNYEVR